MSALVNSLQVRWIVAGAMIIFLSVFAADRLVTAEIQKDPEAKGFLDKAFSQMSQELTDDEVRALRSRVLGYLTTPTIIAIICTVLAVPFFTGSLLGYMTSANGNAALAGTAASVLIVLYLLGELSLGGAVLSVYVIGETVGGSLVGKRIRKRRVPATPDSPEKPA